MTGISTYGQVIRQIEQFKIQQNTISDLSTQLATGKITQKFTGLETNILSSKRARADLQSLSTYNTNITNAGRKVQLMQTAVEGFKDHAREFLGIITGLSRSSTHQQGEVIFYDDPLTEEIENTQVGHTSAEPDVDLKAMVDFADRIFNSFTDILNIKDQGRYLLNGAETAEKPVDTTGTLDAAINTLITNWKGGSITTEDLISDLTDRTTETNSNALTDSTIGFSTALSTGKTGQVYARISETLEVEYTTLANEKAFRDVLVAVSYIKSEILPPIADAYIPPNTAPPGFAPDVLGAPGDNLDDQKDSFYAVIDALGAMVNQAVDDMDLELFKLSSVQARLTRTQINHAEENLFLQNIVSNVEDADQNDVALKLNIALTQIESSYAVSARVQQLSLVNFI